MNGTGGPSALIVHAASLENQFVANGFSHNSSATRSGPTTSCSRGRPPIQPGGRQRREQHRAGVRGRRDRRRRPARRCFSRGAGRTAPPGPLSRNTRCGRCWGARGFAVGAGALQRQRGRRRRRTQIKSQRAGDLGRPCPDGGSVGQADAPAGTSSTAATRPPMWSRLTPARLAAARATTLFADRRGTFDFLASGTDPAGKVPNLKIVTRNKRVGAWGRQRADQLLPRLHHQSAKAWRGRQRYRGKGFRRLPDLVRGSGRS